MIAIDCADRLHVLERLLAVLRIRGIDFSSLRYEARTAGTGRVELVGDVDVNRLRLIAAQIGRIVGVTHVAWSRLC